MKENIIMAIYEAIDQINVSNKAGPLLEKSPKTVLFGESGTLDSLGLINLIVATEEAIERDFEKTITLADDRALSQKVSPFQTVETLAAYIETLLTE